MALIDIGSQKQLLFDDYLMESITDTRQVLNRARKVVDNPVLATDRPWEGNDLRLGQVIFDEREGIFRMWYSATECWAHQGEDGVVVEGGENSFICLANSDDGINWERPELGLVEFEGSCANNILPEEMYMPYLFQDLHEEDPEKRYKGLRRTSGEDGMRFDLYYSPDGFEWSPFPNNPAIDTSSLPGRWGPTHFMGWDPIREVYAVHMENCHHRHCPLGKRVIGRSESPDMLDWTEPETIIIPDGEDYPDTQFYAMPATTYEGVYIGLLWNFRTTNTTHYPEVVFSRDGIHYQRRYRKPFIVQGGLGDFDAVSIYVQAPVIHQEEILVYYTGVNWRSPETLLELGDRARAGIGLARLPIDGFVSLDGKIGKPPAVLTGQKGPASFSRAVTRSFSFSGSKLYLNLESARQQWGAGPCDVRVEILDSIHRPIEGFTFQNADPITSTSSSHIASWDGEPEVGELQGRPVRLRFYFKNAKLYSFQFR